MYYQTFLTTHETILIKPTRCEEIRQRDLITMAEYSRVATNMIALGKRHGLHYYIKGGMYGYANFYIDQSKKYFPTRNLTKFVNFYGMTMIYWCVGIFLLGPATVWMHYTLALLCAPMHVGFLVLYTQHMYVIMYTLRYITAQPTVSNDAITTPTMAVTLSQETFDEQYPQARALGMGVVKSQSNEVEFQVLQRLAMHRMRSAAMLSVVGFLESSLITMLCVGLGICGLTGKSSYCEYITFH